MDWITIILGLLGPIIAKCFQQTSSENPHDVLRAAYNEATGRMDPDLVNDCIPAARQAANKAHRQASRSDRKRFPKLSRADLYEIAETKLIEAMKADGPTINAVLAAGHALGDDD
jgi:hypothetical protein